MKIKITQAGVYDGNGKRIPVGTELNVKGDTMPAWLVGKGEVIEIKRTAVTNPAKGAIKAKAD